MKNKHAKRLSMNGISKSQNNTFIESCENSKTDYKKKKHTLI